MDENTSKAVFNLMQKVVDKLDHISNKVDVEIDTELSNIIIKESNDLKKLIMGSVINQSKVNNFSINTSKQIINSIEKNKTPPVTNNYSEYSILGSQFRYKPWVSIVIIFSLVIIWTSIKYIPSYLTERSSLKKEKEEYQIFYNYVYLKQLKNTEIPNARKTLETIKKKDTILIKEYHVLLSNYEKEIRKQQLQEELISLENNDS
ncbi:hypothetical protein [Wenyingzhuangia aestuarii]|uniref:hypothetical protein n=1 Tax=Wenyingzhuangia aestuarii TaxID=1647582 RepID=UPI00143B84DA|nr:hypothetical protein [Wenyingzhuangia aestuarii]NJB82809.1 hypothetical protein [Wenyingzhuangia aestuarii]